MKLKNLVLFSTIIMVALWFGSCQDETSFDEVEFSHEHNHDHSHGKRTCFSMEHMKNLLSDPQYKAQYEERMNSFN